MKKTIVGSGIVVFICFLMLTACGSRDKGPAELALKAAEEAITATKAEAAKIVPDQVNALENALAAAKDKFAKGDYKAVIEETKALAGKAKEVLDAAKAKTEELTKKWTELSQEIPKIMEDLQSRVEALSREKALPANLTTETFEEIKSELATARDEWAKALESFKTGNFIESVNIATVVKEKAMKAMEALGITAPAPAAT